MRRLIVVLLVGMLLLGSCSSTVTPIIPVTPSKVIPVTPEQYKEEVQEFVEEKKVDLPNETVPPSDINWIMPGKLEVGGYYPGGTVDQSILVHNGNSLSTERKLVISGIDDNWVEIQLKKGVVGTLESIKVSSNEPLDKLVVVNYNSTTRTVRLEGLVDSKERIIEVRYPALTRYSIRYKIPDNTTEGFVKSTAEWANWVTLSETTLDLMPEETREINVLIEIPEGVAYPDKKVEFRIAFAPVEIEGNVMIELSQRWLVSFK